MTAALQPGEPANCEPTAVALLRAKLETAKVEFEEFVGVVSHDFRAPIRGILAMTDWLAAELPPESLSAETSEYMNLMRQRALHLRDMLDAVTEIARFGRFFDATQVSTLPEIAAQACTAANLPVGFSVDVDCDDEEMRVGGCVDALVKAMSCLLENAWQHHPEDFGKINLRMRCSEASMHVEIRDDGDGFPLERATQLHKLFRNGGTPKNKNRLGVGLAYVRRLTTAAGGTFSLAHCNNERSRNGTVAKLQWPNWNIERT